MMENTSLEFFDNPLLYDKVSGQFDGDFQFHLDLIEKYGQPVLEFMCGSGRLTIPYAEKGIDITGLDLSEPMLETAKKKAEDKKLNIEFIKSDCRDFFLKKRYNLIFIPFSSMQLLTRRDDLETCFTSIKANLEKTGRFVFDIFNPDFEILARDPKKRYRVRDFSTKDEGDIEVSEMTSYDRASQIIAARWFYKYLNTGREFEKIFRIRVLFPEEINSLLHYFGFIIEEKYGDYDLSKFESGSPRQLFVCRKK